MEEQTDIFRDIPEPDVEEPVSWKVLAVAGVLARSEVFKIADEAIWDFCSYASLQMDISEEQFERVFRNYRKENR